MALPYDVITVGAAASPGRRWRTPSRSAAIASWSSSVKRGSRIACVVSRRLPGALPRRGPLRHLSTARRARGHQTVLVDHVPGAHAPSGSHLAQTTPHGVGSFNFYHPDMQETLLRGRGGRRGGRREGPASVDAVTPGRPPSVSFRENGQPRELQARLVVVSHGVFRCADGRGSPARDPDRWTSARALVESTHSRRRCAPGGRPDRPGVDRAATPAARPLVFHVTDDRGLRAPERETPRGRLPPRVP